MNQAIRILTATLTFVGTFYFSFWMVFTLMLGGRSAPWIRVPGALLLAALAGRYVWRAMGRPAAGSGQADAAVSVASLGRSVGLGALVTGAVGFVGGFFGPMLFAPDANQGPMLGIFITGPLGVVLGALGGVLFWISRRIASRSAHRQDERQEQA